MAEEATNADTPAPAKDIAEEKAPPEESGVLLVVEGDEKPAATGGLQERDAFLTRVATEKRVSLIRAWEESEKAKAENRQRPPLSLLFESIMPCFCSIHEYENVSRRAARRLASVTSWEKSKVAQMEAELKKIHEQLEVKKAARAEKLRNSAVAVHRAAEEKRAAAVARRGEEVIRAEEEAAGYRARGQAPTGIFGRGLFGRG